MNFAKRQFFAVLACVLLISSFSAASTPQPPAIPRDYVVDLADILTPATEEKLNGLLQELERKTTAQVLVLTVQTLDGQSIDEFSFETKEKWKLGQKGKDNGVLIAVSVKDRKYRLEVGYGLEGILPDSLVGSIGRQYLVPYFRQGDYSTGTYAAALAVANLIAGDAGVEISGMPHLAPPQMSGSGGPPAKVNGLVLGLFFFIALVLFITHPKQCFLILLMNSMGGRGGWSGGGGGFGGGGGSFGGGGGGSGGGGGASGGW